MVQIVELDLAKLQFSSRKLIEEEEEEEDLFSFKKVSKLAAVGLITTSSV